MRQLKIEQHITTRATPAVDKYLSDIRKYPLLRVENEVSLVREIKNGDPAALERLINSNLRFVVSVAKRYEGLGLSLSDLINEGNIGLIHAARHFDETRGFKFISYAVWKVRACILSAINKKARLVRIPANRLTASHTVYKTSLDLSHRLERTPSIEEIAEVLGRPVAQVREELNMSLRHDSLDAPLLDAEDFSLGDALLVNIDNSDEFEFPNNTLADDIENVLSDLTKQEATVIRMVFGLNGKTPMSLVSIGKYLGTHRQVANNIKDRAIRKLKRSGKLDKLRTHLG